MSHFKSTLRLARNGVLLGALLVRAGLSQVPGGPNLATRSDLQEALTRLEKEPRSEVQVKMLRDRLENGDFRAGDRIFVRVAGDQQLTDTFTVEAGPELPLPQLGAVPLHGVLRSELSGLVAAHLERYLREPVVHVQPLIRIIVAGDVQHPGYYAFSPDLPLADAIKTAGGFTQGANVRDIRLERVTGEVWSGPKLQQAIGWGYSIDQLNLRDGDQVLVPARGPSLARTIGILVVTVPAVLYTISLIHW